MMKRRDAAFWGRVDRRSGDCWMWTGARTRKGYGQLHRDGKTVYAHRWVFALAGQDISGFQVDHICHEPSCVRPTHLRLVTNKQNSEHLAGAYGNSQSGIRGVWWDEPARQWHATVGHNGKQYRRRFQALEEAAEWARAKRLELFTHNDADRTAS